MATVTVTIPIGATSATYPHTLGHTDYAIIPVPSALDNKFLVADKTAFEFTLITNNVDYEYNRNFVCIIIEHPITVTATIDAFTDQATVSHSLGHDNFTAIPVPLTLEDTFVVTAKTTTEFTLQVNSTDFENSRAFTCILIQYPTTIDATIPAEEDTVTVPYAFGNTDYNLLIAPQSLEDAFTIEKAADEFTVNINNPDFLNPRTFVCTLILGGEYMSTATEGLNGNLTVNGTTIALLSEVTFEHSRDAKEWVPMGSVDTTDVLLGANTYKVTAKRGFVDNTYLNYIRGGSVLAGTLYPVGGTTVTAYGSLICTNSKLSGIKQAAADPVMEDLTFIFFNVTHT